MRLVTLPAAALAWLGRQGTRAVAALVVVGIALPWIGAMLRPHVTAAVFMLLAISFLRVDIAALGAHVRRPALVIAATAWSAVAVPIILGVSGLAAGLDRRAPDLFLALMLQAIASPMMAAPALAALMGLDATLALATLITSTALIPLTAPVLARVFVGTELSIPPLVLAVRLFAILAGAGVVGLVLRRVLGGATIERHQDSIDGLNILVLFVFVAAVMHDLGTRWLGSPMATTALAALAFAVFSAILLLTAFLFRFAGRERAFALGLVASQRNMGLMLAVSGRALPDLAWLYFALAQFPIYLSPLVLQPLARWVRERTPEGDTRVR